MIYVIAKLPCHEQGASKLIEWSKSDDGFSVTRSYKGFKHIELLVDENNKTLWLYEQWETKEDHQTYLKLIYLLLNTFYNKTNRLLFQIYTPKSTT